MARQILDLEGDGRHLRKDRGFLTIDVEDDGVKRTVRVPLDELEAVIVHARAASYSNTALLALAEHKVPLVLCDQSHRPQAWLWPLTGNFEQSLRMRAQLDARAGHCRKLWATFVKAKIETQAAVLEETGKDPSALKAMARRVRSGDPDNLEAQAAARYWPRLMGADFRRDPGGGGANGLLNYGYTILRSAVARQIVAAGLHPSIGIHHANRFNDFCLVDDVMEPFRPAIDRLVFNLCKRDQTGVNAETKQALSSVLQIPWSTSRGVVPLSRAVEWCCASLASAFVDGKARIEIGALVTGLLGHE